MNDPGMYIGCSLLLALAELTDVERSVFMLHVWHERTFREIGTHLGLDVDDVTSISAKALRKLHRELVGHLPDAVAALAA